MLTKLFATLTISLFIFTSMAYSHGGDVSMSPPNGTIFKVSDADITGGATEVRTYASSRCAFYWDAPNNGHLLLLLIAGDPDGEAIGDLTGSCEGTSLSDYVSKTLPRKTHVIVDVDDTVWVYIAVDPYGTSPLTARTVSATIDFTMKYPWATGNPTNPIIMKTEHVRTLNHSHKFYLVRKASGS